MKKKTYYLLSLSLFLFPMFLQAQLFASLEKLQNAPLHAGIARTYEAPYSPVLKAAKSAMLEAGLSMEYSSKVDENTYMLIGKTRANVTSWGEMVRVVVVKDQDAETSVRVYTKKKVKINITAKRDYSNSILSGIEMKLEI